MDIFADISEPEQINVNIEGSNVTDFLSLTDVDPTTYSGQSGKVVSVNSGEDGLEFTSGGGSGAVDSVFSRTGDVAAAQDDYTWAQINKTSSDIADITTKPHTSLTDIGTNTHTEIDNHISNVTTNPHSVDASDVSLGNVTNVSTDDTAYNATSWDANNDAATKNSLRDKFESLAGGHDPVTLNASATAGGMSLSSQEISNRAATNIQTGYATAAQITSIESNASHVAGDGSDHADVATNTTHRGLTNDPHNVTATQVGLGNVTNVATDDTAYNATSWNTNTDAATKNAIRDKVETMDTAIGLNTSKVTNVSTDLSEGTSTVTTVDINSSDGTNATIVSASTTRAGILTKAKWDEIVVNNGKIGVTTEISDLVDDTTPQLGGNLDLNQKNIILDPTPTSDHTWNGVISTQTAGESVVVGDVCYLKSDGKYWKMDADAVATTKGQCLMATGTISADATGTFLHEGYIRDDTWTWTVGAELWASVTPGNPIATQPSGSGDIVRLVGYAHSADIVYFSPDKTYVEVA